MIAEIAMRPARPDDEPALHEIRQAAFEPVFASFRALLGDELYARVQAKDDEAQGALLSSLLEPGSGWQVHVAERSGEVVGFVSVRLDDERGIGEIGLNAVHPRHAGSGIGTGLYELAVQRMKDGGMRAAVVSTGGDPSHGPARRAYEKAGFTASIPNVWMCRLL